MSAHNKLRKHLYSSVGPALLVAMSLATSDASAGPHVSGPGAPNNTQTKCLTAVAIPAAQANKTGGLQSFDISWVDPNRAEYYLGDRANAGVTIVDTKKLTFIRTIGGFKGVVLNAAGTAVDNNHSGPDGVTSHGRWLYAGDGDSTLKVIDLSPSSANNPIKQSISTGGTTRVDEMALTTDGKLLLAANNAEDPPFATLFSANGDAPTSHVTIITQDHGRPYDHSVPGFGQSLEQPAWDPTTKRFYTSIPWIANNPPGCNANSNIGAITCDGGLLVTDPHHPTAVEGKYRSEPQTPASFRSLPADRMAPRLGRTTIFCWAAPRATTQTTRPRLVINAKTHNTAE